MEGVSRSETGSISWSETEFVSGSEIAGAKTSHLAQRDDRGHLGQRDGQKKDCLIRCSTISVEILGLEGNRVNRGSELG